MKKSLPTLVVAAIAASSITAAAQISVSENLRQSSSLKSNELRLAPTEVFASPAISRAAETQDAPFHCDFTGENDMDLFTLIDGNRDGKCWERNAQGFAALMYNQWQSLNDYIVSPGLKLKKDYVYTLSTASRPYKAAYPEKIEMWVGTEPTAAGLTENILPTTVMTEERWTPLSASFVAPEDGVYYFAIRGVSDADTYALLINYFDVNAGVSGNTPGAPEFEIIRDTDVPKATIRVKAPVKTGIGTALESITSINIYRDDELIGNITNVVPGETYDYVDAEPSVGMHTYSVDCSNAEGTGVRTSATVFTGIYLAVWPSKVTPKVGSDEGEVILDWTPCLEDQLGNPLRADQVTYTIYRIHNGNVGKIAEGVAEPHYVDRVCLPSEQQREVQYTVMSNTSYGQSAGTGSGIFYAGAPYELPFAESFADGEIHCLMFTNGLANYAAGWDIAKVGTYEYPYPENGSDNDNGFLFHRAYQAGEKAEIGTAKIHIPAEIASATLSFDTYLISGNGNTLELNVEESGNINNIDTFSLAGATGWATKTADLTKFAGKTIRIRWINTIATHVLTMLDNIKVTAETASSAIENVDVTDVTAPVEYFNLQGIRVNGDLTPGVYILRQGSEVSKILVK